MAPAVRKVETARGGSVGAAMLVVCLIIIAGGATLPQRLAGMTNTVMYSFAETFYGSLTAGLLIFVPLGWVLWKASRRGGGAYRPSGVEIGLGLFIIAGIVGIYIASDKRSAINHFVFISSPIFMAALLVQLLDSAARIKVLLYTVAALGVVNAYECADQFFSSNDVMVQEYEKNPEAMLSKVGIQPGTYEQMMFQYHLESKDVRGFFSTSNSAGSFMLLAMFAAIAIVVEGYPSMRAGRTTVGEIVGKCIVLAVVVMGLLLTQSKGAIGSAIIAMLLLGVWATCHKWLARHKMLVTMGAIVIVIGIAGAIVAYGSRYGTLPGGKSMLVRWQYWGGAVRMYMEHPLGVGGGNFSVYYPQYKLPAAPETVKDPHDFVLSFLTQYGPLGLAGFMAALLGPFWLVVRSRRQIARDIVPLRDSGFAKLVVRIMILVLLALLCIRPLVMSYEVGANTFVAIFVVVSLLILPLLLFAGTFLLCSLREDAGPFGSNIQAVLLCGVAGVLIHNCIDFALFEPGVLTIFWAVVAAFVAIDFIRERQTPRLITLSGNGMLAGWLVATVAAACFMVFLLVPASKSEFFMEQAEKAVDAGDAELAHYMFTIAAKADNLNSEAAYADGRLYLHEYQTMLPEPNVMAAAQKMLKSAIDRDPAYYKYHVKLAEAYATAAQTSKGNERIDWLRKAHASATDAIARYPGDASTHILLGDIADELGKKAEAIEEYKKAVAIEDSYRLLFARMYPDRRLYSRLGEDKYQYARSRIIELGGKD
jgi:tetratricopeptide (TPR) repeat protein